MEEDDGAPTLYQATTVQTVHQPIFEFGYCASHNAAKTGIEHLKGAERTTLKIACNLFLNVKEELAYKMAQITPIDIRLQQLNTAVQKRFLGHKSFTEHILVRLRQIKINQSTPRRIQNN